MDKKYCLLCSNEVYGSQIFCCSRHRYKYYHNGDMILPLKKQWFDMILAGIKLEEYREVKPYWEKRFTNYFGRFWNFQEEDPKVEWNQQKKVIVFRNGYGNDKPEFSAECTIREDYGKEEWGAEKGKKYYVLTIYRIFGEKNTANRQRADSK